MTQERKLSIQVEAKVTFQGFHRWPEAPSKEIGYLRSPHRHLFVVRARKRVTSDDRETEFILLAQEVARAIAMLYPGDAVRGFDLHTSSCEQVAKALIDECGLSFCSVHEDDENGAIVEVQS